MADTSASEKQDPREEVVSRKRLLPILITVGTLLVAIAHVVWPDLTIDTVKLTLIALAILPWLGELIKTIELPGGLKVEYQELRREMQEVRGQAQSASRIAGAALAGVSTSSLLPATESELDHSASAARAIEQLAAEYNRIRSEMSEGDVRTSAMTEVVGKMIALVPQLNSFDVRRALQETDRGKRLAAYAFLYARPNPDLLEELVTSLIRREDKPFGQYWALRAIGAILGHLGGTGVDATVITQLRDFLAQLPRGTDRHFELSRILQGISST